MFLTVYVPKEYVIKCSYFSFRLFNAFAFFDFRMRAQDN